MNSFTHLDKDGSAVMVDISAKEPTKRCAIARGEISMSETCFKAVEGNLIEKGNVLTIAQIAGIMGTKKTSELIPLCHNINISNSSIELNMNVENYTIEAISTVKTIGETGVEMEALTGVSVALLTIYDMCKSIDKSMEIKEIHLVQKTGGKSGEYLRSKEKKNDW